MRMLERHWRVIMDATLPGLRTQLVAVNIQPVFDWMQGQNKALWHYPDDFPNLAPPWPVAWYEWHDDRRIHFNTPIECGVLSLSAPRTDGSPVGYWYSAQVLFIAQRKGRIQLIVKNEEVVDKDGRLSADEERPTGRKFRMYIFQYNGAKAVNDARGYMGVFAVYWLALSLLHCRNVDAIDEPGHQRGERLERARARRNKPFVQYKVLKIDPIRRMISSAQSDRNVSLPEALHICRGHFKDYRDGRGLFGKLKGLWWWAQQVRGSEQAGRIVKTYEVQSPSDDMELKWGRAWRRE